MILVHISEQPVRLLSRRYLIRFIGRLTLSYCHAAGSRRTLASLPLVSCGVHPFSPAHLRDFSAGHPNSCRRLSALPAGPQDSGWLSPPGWAPLTLQLRGGTESLPLQRHPTRVRPPWRRWVSCSLADCFSRESLFARHVETNFIFRSHAACQRKK